MKITLKELRSIIRESVRQHLKETKLEKISSKIEEIMNKLNNNNFSETDLIPIRTIADFYIKSENKEDLKEKMEDLGKKLDRLSAAPKPQSLGYINIAKQEILDALSGRVHGKTPSPEGTVSLLSGTGFGPGYPIGPGGRYVSDKK